MIKQVTLENFKSYYGKHHMYFSKNFNCIIGPNGSGKSNFIDAIQFVFGKRASQMRCKAVQYLISSGQSFCSVEVKFEKFNIKRVAVISGVSDYFVDDQKVTLTQLYDFLKTQNIETASKFIILQGEVESIALMKPKSGNVEQPGLLEYIEEQQYKDQMEQAQNQMINSRNLTTQENERLNICQNTLNEIKNIVNLDEFVEKIFLKFLHSIVLQNDRNNREQIIQELDFKLGEFETTCRTLEEMMQTSIAEYNQQKKIKETIEFDISQLKDKIKNIVYEMNLIKGRNQQEELLTNQLEVNRSEKLIEAFKADQQNIIQEKEKLEQLIPQKQQKFEKFVVVRDAAEEKYRVLRTSVDVDSKFFYSKKQELELAIRPYVSEINHLKQRLETLQQEHDRTNQGSSSYWHQLIEIQKKTEELVKQQATLQKSIDNQKELQELISEQKSTKLKEIEDFKIKEKQYVNNIEQIQNRLEQNNQDRIDKNDKVTILKAIQTAASLGQLKIIGRLGDLGAIDSKFDTPITTACQALDGIVVETSQDAYNCIQFLKDQKLGRYLFIPIDKIPDKISALMNRQFHPINGAVRLFDQIKFKNDRYKVVFYNFLRDTLVVSNLDRAKVIAYQSKIMRIVTLDGKLIDYNGVMSGGPQQIKGGMSNKFIEELDADRREQLMSEKVEMKEQLDRVRQKMLKAEQELPAILRDEEATKSSYKQRLVDMNMLLDQINENHMQEQNLKQLLDESHLNEERNEQIQKEMDKINIEIKKKELKIGQQQMDLNEVDKKLKEIANQDLNQAKDVFYKSQTDHDTAQQELQRAIAQKLVYEKKILQLNEQIEEEDSKLLNSKNAIYRIQNSIQETQSELKKYEELEKQRREEIEQFMKEYQTSEEACKKIQSEIRSVKQLIEEQENEKQQLQLKLNIEKKQLQEVINKLNEIRYDYQNFLKQFEQDDQNLLFNLNNQNPFKLMLMSSITQTRSKYQLKFKDLNLGQIIELFPIDIPTEIGIIYDLTQYQTQIPLLQELSYDIGNLCSEKDKDISLIKMFIQKSKELEFKFKKFQETEKIYEKEKEIYDNIYGLRRQSLDITFNKITQKLKEIYFKLSDGGDAMLSLIDQGDPFSEGIEFNVKPPGKTWKQISKLSGGEKTLASLSLMLALHFYRPTPLYILDEIDAALDFKNVGIVAQYLNQIKAQFIVVSLRTNMFETASNLVGLYIKDGESSTNVVQLEIN